MRNFECQIHKREKGAKHDKGTKLEVAGRPNV